MGQVIKTKGRNQNGETAEESYTYDLLGRVSSKTSPDGTVQNYTYDNNSNILSYDMVKDNETKNSITYEYNALNQLTSLTNNGIITSYQYDNNGNLTKKLLNNGQTTDYTYNNGGLLSNTTSKKGSKVQTYSECQYMFNGLMTSVKMPCDDESNTMEQKFKSFQYDSLGRLKNEYVSQGAGGVLNSAYTYDTFGNRIKQVDTDGDNYITNTTNYQYDLNNRLIQSSTEYYDEGKDIRKNTAKRYYYDENGNTIAEQEKTYTDGRESSNMSISGRIGGSSLKVYKYDAFNRLIQYNDSVSEATYTYGANNLRASKTVNGAETDFVWNGQNLAGEFQNDTVNTYTYDVTGVHMANQNGTIASYIKDYHGNIVAKANTSGNMIDEMIDRRDYDAFGNHRNGAEADPFGYCGEYLDSESGLIYLRNRYYQAETGRFITEDPVKDGLNWYSYCAGNPVMSFDPSGLLNIPENGIKAFNEMISACNELIDCLTNQINNGITERLLNDEKRIKEDKIKLNQLLWNSSELNDLVNEIIVNNDNVTVQQVSCIIKIVYEAREDVITLGLNIGDEVISEEDIRPMYDAGRSDGTVFLTAGGLYPIESWDLVPKILPYGYQSVYFGARYRGNNGNGMYQEVVILEREGIDNENSGVSDQYPFAKYQGKYRGFY